MCNFAATSQEEQLIPPMVCSRVRVARSLVFYIVFCISLFVPFFLAIIFVFPSLIFHFWFSFWYLQTFLIFWLDYDDNHFVLDKSMGKSVLLLAHYQHCTHVDMSLHLDTSSQFRASQALVLPNNVLCISIQQQITLLRQYKLDICIFM